VKVTFETITIADVIKKAARVAPTKGAAADFASGLLIELTPAYDPQVTVKATDGDITFLEWTTAVEFSSQEDETWRVPAALLATILGSFPNTQTSTVTMERREGVLEVRSGKKRATLFMMQADSFPPFEAWDDSGLQEVENLSARMAQVSWACDNRMAPLTGIHIDGERLYATDRFRLATVPCKVPIDNPITLPTSILAPILQPGGSARVGVFGERFYMMPDESTQITANTFAVGYPNISKAMQREYPNSITISAQRIKEMVDAMVVVVKSERFPRLDLTIGNERLHVQVEGESGFMEDTVDLVAQAIHEDFTVYLGPKNFTDALGNSPNDQLMLAYNSGNPNSFLYFAGANGYEAWIAPRAKNAPAEEA
jgi:DNA polymerase III sliding clamp (beta) subunit (PCNA family)